jgi:GTP-binding protein HflX
VARLAALHPEAVAVSAATGAGITEMLAAVDDRLTPPTADLELLIPYERGDLLAALHRDGEVIGEDHEDAGTRVKVRVPREAAAAFAPYRV